MDKVQAHDEETQGSGSGSAYSDISALENETDEFGRVLLRHQRDAQRLNSALRSGQQQPFRRAKPRPRIEELLESQEKARQEAQVGQNHERIENRESNDLEPHVTVPRQWGRRAKRQPEWMKRITAVSDEGDTPAETIPKPDEETKERPRLTYNGAGWDFQPLEEELVESIENTPPSMRRRQHDIGTPSSLRHMNTTLRPGRHTDSQEFNIESFLASTPAPTRLPRKIDDLARQEIEELERESRALNSLDQPRTNTTTRRTSSAQRREREQANGLLSPPASRPVTSSGHSPSPSRIPRPRPHNIGDKENVRPRSVDEDARSDGSDELAKRSSRAVNIKNAQHRPSHHQRHDSLNLLKKLARVSSMSPSPARGRDEQLPRSRATVNGDIDGIHRQALPNGAGTDVDVTPIRIQQADMNTPVVAGAWVDTTLNLEPSKEQTAKESLASTKLELHSQRKFAEPSHPKSALEAIMQEAQSRKGVPEFGESTMQSLNDIVNPDLEPTEGTINADFNTPDEENLDDGRALTQAEKDRRQEDLAMEAMNKHLRNARTTIKDANKGLRRVENRIETAHEIPFADGSKAMIVASSPGLNVNGTFCCENCGACHSSVWGALWTELRSCFYIYDKRSLLGFRLTRLGAWCLAFWFWYMIEVSLPDIYQEYRYAGSRFINMYPGGFHFPIGVAKLIFYPLLRPFRWVWGQYYDAFIAWWMENVVPKDNNIPRILASIPYDGPLPVPEGLIDWDSLF